MRITNFTFLVAHSCRISGTAGAGRHSDEIDLVLRYGGQCGIDLDPQDASALGIHGIETAFKTAQGYVIGDEPAPLGDVRRSPDDRHVAGIEEIVEQLELLHSRVRRAVIVAGLARHLHLHVEFAWQLLETLLTDYLSTGYALLHPHLHPLAFLEIVVADAASRARLHGESEEFPVLVRGLYTEPGLQGLDALRQALLRGSTGRAVEPLREVGDLRDRLGVGNLPVLDAVSTKFAEGSSAHHLAGLVVLTTLQDVHLLKFIM
jgi:hypothetical protein